MTTVLEPAPRGTASRREAARPVRRPRAAATRQVAWLLGGAAFGFAVPFVFSDLLGLQRDLFYGVYAIAVGLFVTGWARHTGLTGRRVLARNWRWGLALGVLGAAAMIFTVLRTEETTERAGGVELATAIFWRGIVYGLTDGVLLSVFPILAVFAAFAGTRLRRRALGTALVAAVALIASMGVTATYHLGYPDFRSDKLRRPIAGDVIWSAPTLLTLSPLGAPIAHAGLHVAAVVHSYETDLFLPPHQGTGEVEP